MPAIVPTVSPALHATVLPAVRTALPSAIVTAILPAQLPTLCSAFQSAFESAVVAAFRAAIDAADRSAVESALVAAFHAALPTALRPTFAPAVEDANRTADCATVYQQADEHAHGRTLKVSNDIETHNQGRHKSSNFVPDFCPHMEYKKVAVYVIVSPVLDSWTVVQKHPQFSYVWNVLLQGQDPGQRNVS